MRYYRGRWDEDRGDQFASWGASDWYFVSGQGSQLDIGRGAKISSWSTVDYFAKQRERSSTFFPIVWRALENVQAPN